MYAKVISTEKLFPPYFEERILKLCKVVYVVSPVTYADTGEETVTWTGYPLADVPKYYTSSKKSLCAFAEVNGERKVRYKRLVNMKISAEHGLMMGTSQTTFAPDTVPTQGMEDMPVRHLLLIMATAVVIQLW